MCYRRARPRIEWRFSARRLGIPVKDPKLLNEAGKANLEVNPGSGEDLERTLESFSS
jgi:hypothetical protein